MKRSLLQNILGSRNQFLVQEQTMTVQSLAYRITLTCTFYPFIITVFCKLKYTYAGLLFSFFTGFRLVIHLLYRFNQVFRYKLIDSLGNVEAVLR